jgi:hypothetical protein
MRVCPLVQQAVLGVTILTLLAGPLGPARATPVRTGGVLVWPVPDDLWPEPLDSALAVDPASKEIVSLLYRGGQLLRIGWPAALLQVPAHPALPMVR